MLSSVHASPVATAPARAAALHDATAAIPRSPGRLPSARTLEELRELLGTLLRALFPEAIAFDLHVADARGALVRVGDGPALLESDGLRVASTSACSLAAGAERSSPRALPLLRCGRGSTLSAPLVDADERRIGLLAVEAPPGAPEFVQRDDDVLEGIAALASLAVQRLRLTEPDPRRARHELDRRAASGVQRRLMSGSLSPTSGVTALTEYLPALDVGGDFYCLKDLGDGTIAAAIGDVSGNGVSAALLMSRVAADIERALAAGHAPSAVLDAVNASLLNVESEAFVTASCLRLDTRSRKVTVANAGHVPLIVRRGDGRVFTCGEASGMPLGMAPCEYQDEELGLEPGDIVLLVTDGVLEALDYPSGQTGLDLLMKLLQQAPHDPAVIRGRIRSAVDRARSRHTLDDVTWVVLQASA